MLIFILELMLSKSERKLVKSLQIKKYRQANQLFLVEGEKNLLELLKSSFEVYSLFCTNIFFEKHQNLLLKTNYQILSISQLEQITTFKSNNAGVALVKIPQKKAIELKARQFYIALDNIQDPGNLGTILRIADWYAFPHIICSLNTVDMYNPKVIAASMGAFTRVKVVYENLEELLKIESMMVYGATMEGNNLHQFQFEKDRGGIILMGNESQGIGLKLRKLVQKFISIPKFGGAESLNVAIAAGIICDNLRKQIP